MKLYRLLSLTIALAFLAGCGGQNGTTGGSPTSTSSLPTPVVHVTSAPDPQSAIRAFLDAWQKDDYAGMYPLLSQNSQAATTQDAFVLRYRNAMDSLTLKELSYEVFPTNPSPQTAQVAFRVTYKTRIAGDLVRDMVANLVLENGQWRIDWNDGLVLPELKDGATLSLDYQLPERGIIYDRNNEPLVTQTDIMALGVIPVQLGDGEAAMLGELSRMTGQTINSITALYDDKRNTDWYVPVGEAPLAEVNKRFSLLSSLGGLVMTQYNSRFYFGGGIAPQTVGYVSPVPKEQLDQYIRQGYSPAARVGQSGIERWGENLLAGKTGGTLYLIGKDGKVISTLGKSEAQPASSIYLTLDQNLQIWSQRALVGFRGSIVVLERDTGRVLAMVSSPGFDQNLFDPNNANSGYALGNLINDPDNPMYNRAVQGQYPLGSVFKVITFSAALESGTYTPDTIYQCGYEFNELPDRTLYDWTWEHVQREMAAGKEPPYTQPSGKLTLIGGLMRSCNPYFYHIGVDLYNQGRVTAIADMARGFGLGSKTGLGQLEESAGTIVNPPGLIDATNQAIGQGDVLVTPLQVADFMAAIGNGGTLYRPQLVEKTVDGNGVETAVFKPESRGVLPVKPETLASLREAMHEVIKNPRGTAYYRFTNLEIPVFGKTGTAQTTGTSHAWFAGYTDMNNPDKPDIAIAVIAENAGEGSEYAAPIFKRVVETYFFGQPRSPYWWESNIGITRTPTEPVTPTPQQ
jgi:penicillin-binding protein 2